MVHAVDQHGLFGDIARQRPCEEQRRQSDILGIARMFQWRNTDDSFLDLFKQLVMDVGPVDPMSSFLPGRSRGIGMPNFFS